MRWFFGVIFVAFISVSYLYYQSDMESRRANLQHAQTIAAVRAELAAISNRAVSVEGEMATVRTQMLAQVVELEQSVTNLTGQKAQIEDRAKELQGRLEIVEKDFAEVKTHLAAVEDQREKVAGRLNVVSNDLETARMQFNELQKTNQATVMELDMAKAKITALEQERSSLLRQLNDIDTLRTQIQMVKRRLWDEHITEWKKRDAEAGSGGNSGILLKNGQWQTNPAKPSS